MGIRVWGFWALFLSIVVHGALQADLIVPGKCPGGIAGQIIIPGNAKPVVSWNESDFRTGLLKAARQRSVQQNLNLRQMSPWISLYERALEEKDGEASGANQILVSEIEEKYERLSESEKTEAIAFWFGIDYKNMTGVRLKVLFKLFLMQEYLAKFEERLLAKLTVQVPMDQPILSAGPAVLYPVFETTTQELAFPDDHWDQHLGLLPYFRGIRTYRILDKQGVLRIDGPALETAAHKANEYSSDARVPEPLRKFIQGYLIDVTILGRKCLHPIIVDWVESLEAFLDRHS